MFSTPLDIHMQRCCWFEFLVRRNKKKKGNWPPLPGRFFEHHDPNERWWPSGTHSHGTAVIATRSVFFNTISRKKRRVGRSETWWRRWTFFYEVRRSEESFGPFRLPPQHDVRLFLVDEVLLAAVFARVQRRLVRRWRRHLFTGSALASCPAHPVALAATYGARLIDSDIHLQKRWRFHGTFFDNHQSFLTDWLGWRRRCGCCRGCLWRVERTSRAQLSWTLQLTKNENEM